MRARDVAVGLLFALCLALMWGAWQASRVEAAEDRAVQAEVTADSLAHARAETEGSLARALELVRVQDSVLTADTARLRSQARRAQRVARAASEAGRAALDSLRAHVDSSAMSWLDDVERTHRLEVEALGSEIQALRIENRRLLGLTTTQRAALTLADSIRASLEAENAALRVAVDEWERVANPGLGARLFTGARWSVPTALLVLGAVAIF